jgi:hypothetical protein
MTVVDKEGNTSSVFINDPRIKSGELVSINKNRVYINNGNTNKMIYRCELNEYIEDGWKIGMIKKGNIIINKDGVRKLIPEYELDNYIKDGWTRGQGKTKPKSGRPKKIL